MWQINIEDNESGTLRGNDPAHSMVGAGVAQYSNNIRDTGDKSHRRFDTSAAQW